MVPIVWNYIVDMMPEGRTDRKVIGVLDVHVRRSKSVYQLSIKDTFLRHVDEAINEKPS